jgi:NAD(P)-dependent dehydrogenase (short-subunit alcohol dehydrogenase family)
VLVGDLADPEAVHALAAQIHDHTNQLHALVHTAAALTPDRQETRAGHELMFATNLLFAFELARRLQDTKVTSNAYHPGALQSSLMRQMSAMVRLLTWPVGRRPDRAAHALSALALDSRYEQATGRFYKRERPAKAPKNSQDTHAQQRLWAECQQLLGIA